MIRKQCTCGARYAVASDCMPGHTGVSVPCRRCGANVYFVLQERPAPEPRRTWLDRWRAKLTGEVLLFDSGHLKPVGTFEPVLVHPELVGLFTPPQHEAEGPLESADDLATIIDWHGSPDDVVESLAAAAAAWNVAPLWSEAEVAGWCNADDLPTWQLVDELVGRFEDKDLAAFDSESRSDTYGLLFVRKEQQPRAAELALSVDPDGDLRPFRRRKFAAP